MQRHFEMNPAINAATATGTITLYFSQAEFDAYNNNAKVVNGTYPKLPSGPNDANNIKNIKVSRVKGASSNNSGLRESYNGKTSLLTTKAIWNSQSAWWEVQFKVNGFGGLFLHTGTTPLTLQAVALTASLTAGNDAELKWKLIHDADEQPGAAGNNFIIERSADEKIWQPIGNIYSALDNTSWTDAAPLYGYNYYRVVKQNAVSGNEKIYSNEERIEVAQVKSSANIFPNPAKDKLNIITTKAVKAIQLSSATGQLLPVNITPGNTAYQLNITGFKTGTYILEIFYDDEIAERKKVIIE